MSYRFQLFRRRLLRTSRSASLGTSRFFLFKISLNLLTSHQEPYSSSCHPISQLSQNHRRRLRGKPGNVPPIIEKRPCIHHLLPPFSPIFWFAHPIFLTSLRQWSELD